MQNLGRSAGGYSGEHSTDYAQQVIGSGQWRLAESNRAGNVGESWLRRAGRRLPAGFR